MCRPNDDGHNIWVSGEEKKWFIIVFMAITSRLIIFDWDERNLIHFWSLVYAQKGFDTGMIKLFKKRRNLHDDDKFFRIERERERENVKWKKDKNLYLLKSLFFRNTKLFCVFNEESGEKLYDYFKWLMIQHQSYDS